MILKSSNNHYEYNILNYWRDNDELYVNYIISNIQNNQQANVIEYYNISDLACDYVTSNDAEIKENLKKLVVQNKGLEFNLPKVSEISALLKYVYNTVCESESNMCHITSEDWIDLVDEYHFDDNDISILKDEIEKYDIGNYITIDSDGYVICGYGGLQACFNNNLVERNDEYER